MSARDDIWISSNNGVPRAEALRSTNRYINPGASAFPRITEEGQTMRVPRTTSQSRRPLDENTFPPSKDQSATKIQLSVHRILSAVRTQSAVHVRRLRLPFNPPRGTAIWPEIQQFPRTESIHDIRSVQHLADLGVYASRFCPNH